MRKPLADELREFLAFQVSFGLPVILLFLWISWKTRNEAHFAMVVLALWILWGGLSELYIRALRVEDSLSKAILRLTDLEKLQHRIKCLEDLLTDKNLISFSDLKDKVDSRDEEQPPK